MIGRCSVFGFEGYSWVGPSLRLHLPFFSDSESVYVTLPFLSNLVALAMPIVPPEDFDDAVQPLPEDQFPYGKGCRMGCGIQAILFHYKINQSC